MSREIVFLGEAVTATDCIALLRQRAPDVAVSQVETLDALERICARPGDATRLIAFNTAVIVPPALLDALGSPAYNIHPGPPTYPGRFPSCFAIYDGAPRFGATAHVMTERVDAGPIVGVEWFEIAADIDRLQLDILTYRAAVALFARLAPLLVESAAPLPPLAVAWSGRKTTQRDFEALCALPPDVDAGEFERCYRAVGEGPHHALTITVHGQRFRLDNERRDDAVCVAGHAVG